MTGEFDRAQTEAWHRLMPFARTLGLEVLASGKQEVRARLGWSEELCTVGGVVHGGAIMSLADSAAATCAFLNLPEGASGTATIASTTNFLVPPAKALSKQFHVRSERAAR